MYNLKEYSGNEEKIYLPDKNAVGSTDVKYPINVFTEFGNLKGVIIGYFDKTAMMAEDLSNYSKDMNIGPYDKKIIDKNQEIQDSLATKLQNRGITVVRPGEYDFSKKFNVMGYETYGFHAFNPRDLILFYHDSIYEFPTFQVCRQTEYEVFNHLNYQFRDLGCKWFKSFKGLNTNYEKLRQNQGYKGNEEIDPHFPFFDAANLIKLGLDILFLISESANEEGYDLFNTFLKKRYNNKVRLHPLRGVYETVHVDTIISVIGFNEELKKYIVVLSKKYFKPSNIPAIFRGKNWIIMEGPDLEPMEAVPGYELTSPEEIGLNFFTVNSKLVVVEERQKKLMKWFSHYGIESISHPNPYGRESAGAFHCMTNDYNREEVMDFKKVVESKDDNLLSKTELAGLFDEELLEFLNKESNGKLDDWASICNKNNIFPSYLTDHLSKEELDEMEKRHKSDINSLIK